MPFTKVAPAGIGTEPGDGYRIGDSFLHATGLSLGSGTTISHSGSASFSGIVTASSFVGSGSGLTGVASTDHINSSTNAVLSGIVTAGTLNVSGNATVTGTLGVGGTLTYEDVTNIDSIGIITARSTVSIADSIIHTGDTDTSFRFSGADTIALNTGGVERLQINSQGKPTFNTPGGDDAFLVKGDNFTGVRIQAARNDASDKAMFQMLGSRGTNASPTILQSGDTIGTLSARGYDGNSYAQSANIFFTVSTTPGDGDMPGKIQFATASDGSESPSTRMTIDHNGFVTTPNQPTFHAYGNNSWTQYTGSNNIVKLLNSACNVGGHYKTSGSDEGKFVCPIAGNYFFYLTLYSGRTDNGQTDNNDYLSINFISSSGSLSNNGGHHIRHYYNEGDRDSTSTLSIIKTCTAGETMHIMISCNGTGYQVYGGHSGFGGYLIG